MAAYQNFVDRVCRALVFSTTKMTIRRMEGKVTMQDLRNMVGFPMIEEMITRRQYQYLGHLGRYNKIRIEARMLNAWLQIDGDAPPKRLKNTKMTVRSQSWKLISEHEEHGNTTRRVARKVEECCTKRQAVEEVG